MNDHGRSGCNCVELHRGDDSLGVFREDEQRRCVYLVVDEPELGDAAVGRFGVELERAAGPEVDGH